MDKNVCDMTQSRHENNYIEQEQFILPFIQETSQTN